jgi:hypothetical protein
VGAFILIYLPRCLPVGQPQYAPQLVSRRHAYLLAARVCCYAGAFQGAQRSLDGSLISLATLSHTCTSRAVNFACDISRHPTPHARTVKWVRCPCLRFQRAMPCPMPIIHQRTASDHRWRRRRTDSKRWTRNLPAT